jgi:hypothetical protein
MSPGVTMTSCMPAIGPPLVNYRALGLATGSRHSILATDRSPANVSHGSVR